MSGEILTDREVLIMGIGHPKVTNGEWLTPYNLLEDWKLIKNLPLMYQDALDQAMMVFQVLPIHWQMEGFIHSSDGEVDSFTVSLAALIGLGSPSKKIPLFGPPSLDINGLILPFLRKHSFKRRRLFEFQFPDLAKVSNDHLYIPMAAWVDRSKKAAEIIEEVILGKPPTYQSWIVVMPFHFFERKSEEIKIVGNDPFRFMFQLGIETQQLVLTQPNS